MSSKMLVMTGDYKCQSCSSTGQNKSALYIRSAVGNASPPRCYNYPEDVKTIQRALNRFSPLEGGPMVPLVVDGICGPLTKKAIYDFQGKLALTPSGSFVPDGIVDPNGKTLERLSSGPTRPTNLPAEFAAMIPRVLEIITATCAAIFIAKNFITSFPSVAFPLLGGAGKLQVDKLDRHFHIQQKSNPVSRINEIEQIYLLMQSAIGYVPQGVIVAADEPADFVSGTIMFTFPGAYHRRDPNDMLDGIHRGSIYLTPRARWIGQDAFAYSMIHELAHYVGPVLNNIDDYAYFHREPEKYKNLNADTAFKNADNYAQFSFDVIGKPNFNVLH